MNVITTRLDEKDAKELQEIETAEKSDRSVVVRKLLSIGVKQWKLENSIKKLRKGDISIGRAAEMAGIPYSEMLELMPKENIQIGYSVKDIENDMARIRKK